MKKLFVFFFLAGWVLFVSAQEDKNTVTLERKNVLKFLPVNLPFQSLSFEFERMINAKNSITLGIGLPNQKSIIGKYGIDGSSDLKTAELGTMHLRAAYRHYTGKSMLPRGFYIEPYLKYQEIKGAASISGTDSQTNQPYTGDLNAKFNTMNVGLQFGAQFLIGKRISLDFYFLGLEAGMLTGDATAVTNAPTDAINIADDINTAKNDNLPAFIADKITVTQSGNQVNAKVSSVPYPWIRGGISIGFAF